MATRSGIQKKSNVGPLNKLVLCRQLASKSLIINKDPTMALGMPWDLPPERLSYAGPNSVSRISFSRNQYLCVTSLFKNYLCTYEPNHNIAL